jgi:ketol-acid reductoisomerase
MEAYYDPDASLEVLRHRTLGIIGYGNQGRAQALNLRDSGLEVIIGGLRDETAGQAEKDGFAVRSVTEVAERADVLALLIPDEVQRQVYADVVSTRLRAGQTLDFAHGYNIRFGLIVPPQDIDVIMVAPRMIGTMVREAFVKGGGAPAYIAVAEDAAEIFREMARVGFFKQMRLHSQTSQYGTLSRAGAVPFAKQIRAFMKNALEGIRDGAFDREWRREQAADYPVFKKLRADAEAHSLNQAETEMRRLMRYQSE